MQSDGRSLPAGRSSGLVASFRKVQLSDELARRLATDLFSLRHAENQLSLGLDRCKQQFAFNDVSAPSQGCDLIVAHAVCDPGAVVIHDLRSRGDVGVGVAAPL